MTKQAPISRILKNDYTASMMLIMIAVMWGLLLVGSYFGSLPGRRGSTLDFTGENLTSFIILNAVITLVCGVWAYVRISTIRRVINAGSEVTGVILGIGFAKDRGRVEYQYEHEGQTYRAGNAIKKNAQTSQLLPGTSISLMVDPQKPSRAFITNLYV